MPLQADIFLILIRARRHATADAGIMRMQSYFAALGHWPGWFRHLRQQPAQCLYYFSPVAYLPPHTYQHMSIEERA